MRREICEWVDVFEGGGEGGRGYRLGYRGLSAARRAQQHDRMTNIQQFLKLHHFQDKRFFWLLIRCFAHLHTDTVEISGSLGAEL